jgi:ParB family chromosome partitioning protein
MRGAPGEAWGQFVNSADLLKWLAANGYQLSAVEEVITGERTGEHVFEETLTGHQGANPDE